MQSLFLGGGNTYKQTDASTSHWYETSLFGIFSICEAQQTDSCDVKFGTESELKTQQHPSGQFDSPRAYRVSCLLNEFLQLFRSHSVIQ